MAERTVKGMSDVVDSLLLQLVIGQYHLSCNCVVMGIISSRTMPLQAEGMQFHTSKWKPQALLELPAADGGVTRATEEEPAVGCGPHAAHAVSVTTQ